MGKGSILGYDLNEKYCQISYYDEKKNEPETLEISSGNYQIPLALGYCDDEWIYGKSAELLAKMNDENIITDLYARAMRREKVELAGKKYDSVWLLAKFISLTLEQFKDIKVITFTSAKTDVDMSKMMKAIGRSLGLAKENVHVQDYKESFCYYMFNQPKELWQYESALFYCDEQKINASMLKKLQISNVKGKEMFVTVDEVASANIEELKALSSIMNEEKAKTADESFQAFIRNVFEKKVISSVFLTGDGFEKNWYPNSLKMLCNGRRAFIGNNLYSKGACYTSIRKYKGYTNGPVYLDETRMTEQISLRMRVDGKEGWYPIVAWGKRWYEADGQWEVILEDISDIEVHIETLAGDELQVETISLEGLEERKDYSLRLQIAIMFLDEKTCRMTLRDVGFGEFFASTGFYTEKVIHLGGSNGQFNSMS